MYSFLWRSIFVDTGEISQYTTFLFSKETVYLGCVLPHMFAKIVHRFIVSKFHLPIPMFFGLISWIQTVWHLDGIPKSFFLSWFWKKISRQQKHSPNITTTYVIIKEINTYIYFAGWNLFQMAHLFLQTAVLILFLYIFPQLERPQ